MHQHPLSSAATLRTCPSRTNSRERKRKRCFLQIAASVVMFQHNQAEATPALASFRGLHLRCGGVDNENITTTRSQLGFISSIFQLNNEVKSETSVSEDLVFLPRNDGRGGALVKVAKSPPRILSWLSSASPKVVEGSVTEASEETSRWDLSVPKAEASGVRRLWWVNTWADIVLEDQVVVDEEVTEPEQTTMALAPNKTEAEEIEDEYDDQYDDEEEEEEIEVVVAVKVDENVDPIDDGDPELNATSIEEIVPQQSALASLSDFPPPANTAIERPIQTSRYVSSGYWGLIDDLVSFGYARSHASWRLSSRLRPLRKATARVTGLHGFISGKSPDTAPPATKVDEGYMGIIRRRLEAIDRARRQVEEAEASERDKRRGGLFRRRQKDLKEDFSFVIQKDAKERMEEARRQQRVKEIDRLFREGQQHLAELACEKDMLQRRPCPLWNYTVEETSQAEDGNTTEKGSSGTLLTASREFTFPQEDLVEEYLNMLFLTGRLVRMNHTGLWREGDMMDDDDDDEDELEMEADTGRRRRNGNGGNGNGGSGNWLLRHGLGEKIGVSVETAAYKSVCTSVMGVLARALSSIHGINVMAHTDIRVSVEQAPDLPPMAAGIIPGSTKNYAREAIHDAMLRGAGKHRKQKSKRRQATFIQLDAVVETLLSQCQISAPLLGVFPLAWQRAMLANIIILVTAVISDFCDGLEFQILGHRLSFAFTPVTEEDMIRGIMIDGFHRQRADPEQFEAAIRATAADLSKNLVFLDRWHHRALGSGMLREQIANLIARLVLTLIDDVLRSARMDLWASHAGGPRLVSGLEPRATTSIKQTQT